MDEREQEILSQMMNQFSDEIAMTDQRQDWKWRADTSVISKSQTVRDHYHESSIRKQISTNDCRRYLVVPLSDQ